MILLAVGMAAGGFYLLDYIVTGETILVPNLYGKEESDAIKILAQYDLTFKLTDDPQERTDVDPGLVVSQRPAPGSEVKKGREITLVISQGRKEAFVPDFTNRRLAEIRSDLRSAGLEIGQKAAVYHPTLPADIVIAQDPASGRRTLNNMRVNLLVSLGPYASGYVMPNLMGMDLDSVRRRIETAPFDLPQEGIQYVRTDDASKWNQVISQTPSAGSRIQENDHISITIGASGIKTASLRMLKVTFPIPADLYRNDLVLVVWDDISSQFEYPGVFPVETNLWEETISQTIPVIGDAVVSLSLRNDDPDIPVYLPFYTQYFPAKK
ncbi:MAG: PASTA domain-containing protein [Candidatus Omnitrophica bacterium]|nr:PASTA domain-containing protein [Candidatus Omnitrophota bacterium]